MITKLSFIDRLCFLYDRIACSRECSPLDPVYEARILQADIHADADLALVQELHND